MQQALRRHNSPTAATSGAPLVRDFGDGDRAEEMKLKGRAYLNDADVPTVKISLDDEIGDDAGAPMEEVKGAQASAV